MLVFATRVPLLTGHPLEYTVFPLVIWAGLRFAHPGAALVSATISAIAIGGTLHGTGPFAAGATLSQEGLILLQIYTGVTAASGLVLGAAIADRNRSDSLRQTDHALTTILSEERDLKHATPRVIQVVCETLEWDVGILWQANDALGTLEYVDSWHRIPRFEEFVIESRTREFRPGIGLPGRVWSSRHPTWIYDVTVESNFTRQAIAHKLNLHGGFAFPLMTGTRVLGVMEFFTTDPRQVDRSLLTLMEAAGAQIGQFIERRRAENEREQLLARERTVRLEAEAANRSKDQFLATVSHELRTPLTAILGWASMLKTRTFDPQRTQQIYESLERNAQAQAQIVGDLLDVSRIVTGQLRLESEPIDVCDTARLSLETIRPTTVAKNVALVSNISPGPCLVSGDPARLQQIIWNLLSNAAKFTPAGGTISVAVRRESFPRGHRGIGHRHRYRRGSPAARLRSLLAGRRLDDAGPWRARAWARAGAASRRAPRRRRLGHERRGRPRQHACRPAAGSLGSR